jgi:hypothetical protein
MRNNDDNEDSEDEENNGDNDKSQNLTSKDHKFEIANFAQKFGKSRSAKQTKESLKRRHEKLGEKSRKPHKLMDDSAKSKKLANYEKEKETEDFIQIDDKDEDEEGRNEKGKRSDDNMAMDDYFDARENKEVDKKKENRRKEKEKENEDEWDKIGSFDKMKRKRKDFMESQSDDERNNNDSSDDDPYHMPRRYGIKRGQYDEDEEEEEDEKEIREEEEEEFEDGQFNDEEDEIENDDNKNNNNSTNKNSIKNSQLEDFIDPKKIKKMKNKNTEEKKRLDKKYQKAYMLMKGVYGDWKDFDPVDTRLSREGKTELARFANSRQPFWPSAGAFAPPTKGRGRRSALEYHLVSMQRLLRQTIACTMDSLAQTIGGDGSAAIESSLHSLAGRLEAIGRCNDENSGYRILLQQKL